MSRARPATSAGIGSRIAERFAALMAARHPPSAGSVTLNQRRIYILPTRAALIFALAVLALLIGSINYGLQLGFMLCFLVAAMALAGMHATHANLAGLQVLGESGEPAFAGDAVHFRFALTNPARTPRRALRLAFAPRAVRGQASSAPLPAVEVDLAADEVRTIAVPLATARRGRVAAPRLVIATRFPLGLWRAWAYVVPTLSSLVYPRPEADPPPLPAPAGGAPRGAASMAGGDEFAGVRPYRVGDPAKTVAWKLAARSGELAVKLNETSGGGELVLDWSALPAALDTEARLARLCRWLLDAEAAGLAYGLALPGEAIAVGRGAAQLERCLAALALFKG